MKRSHTLRIARISPIALVIAAILVSTTGPQKVSAAEKLPPAVAKYPERPITYIVPWPAGGRSDAYARILQPHFEKELGAPFVVTNRTGGVGVVGATAVQRAAPDGYTLGQWTGALFLQQFTTTPPLEWKKSVGIAGLVRTSMLLSVNRERPWKTVAEFVKYVQGNPGKVRLATSGVGATDSIYFHAFLQVVGGGKVTVVPYGGDAPAVTALARGEADAAFIPLAGVIAFRDDLRFLAVASETRMGPLPEVPTMLELGIKYTASAQDAMIGPAGLHPEIQNKLEGAVGRVLAKKEVEEQLGKIFLEPSFLTGKELQAFVNEWNPRWDALVTELGLRKK